MSININFRGSNGKVVSLSIDASIAVSEMKQIISSQIDIPAQQQRAVYSGHVMNDSATVASYNIKEGNTVYIVKNASQSSTSSTSAVPTPATTNPQAANPFAGGLGGLGDLGGLGGLGGGLDPSQMMNNPELMRQMMNNPLVQSLMDNPEFMRSIMMSNPQIQQLLQSRPELASMMNDPSFFRQMSQLARNPDLMRQVQRNTDFTMQSIENLPGGFDALRRMYTEYQEPMMEAVTSRNQTTEASTDVPVPDRPTSTPLPSPWAQQSSNPTASTAAANPFASFGASPFGMNPFLPQTPSNQNAQNSQTTQTASQANTQTLPTAFPGLGGNVPGADPYGFSSLMSNPEYQQWASSIMSNPEAIRSILGSNPYAPMNMNQLFQNPAMFPQSTTPTPTASTTPANAAQNLEQYEERYASQLQQLQEMGFDDKQKNILALLASGGNVNSAVNRLLSQ